MAAEEGHQQQSSVQIAGKEDEEEGASSATPPLDVTALPSGRQNSSAFLQGSCPICLRRLGDDAAMIYECLHAFCFSCILSWASHLLRLYLEEETTTSSSSPFFLLSADSKVHWETWTPTCPLCKSSFKRLMIDIESEYVYETLDVRALLQRELFQQQQQHEGQQTEEQRRHKRRRQEEDKDSEDDEYRGEEDETPRQPLDALLLASATTSRASQRSETGEKSSSGEEEDEVESLAAVDRPLRHRRRLYLDRLSVLSIEAAPGTFDLKYLCKSDDDMKLWIERDLYAIVGEEFDASIIVRLILSALRANPGSVGSGRAFKLERTKRTIFTDEKAQEALGQRLESFIPGHGDAFVRELLAFASCRLNMKTFDAVVRYGKDSD